MKYWKSSSLLLACFVIGGCATPAYVSPAGVAQAELKLVASGGVFAGATIYAEAELCRGMRSPGELIKVRERVVPIPAGKPLSFSMESIGYEGGLTWAQCRIVLTFNPLAGHSYAAVYEHDGAPNQCTIRLTDTTASAPSPIDGRKRIFTPPATRNSPSCK